MKFIQKMSILLTVLFFLFFIGGCGGSSVSKTSTQEEVKGGKVIANVPADALKEKLLKQKSIDENTTVFGFKAYKITYTTTDEEGKSVKASGVMIIPSSSGVSDSDAQKLESMEAVGLGLVVDCHGTIFSNNEAPSIVIENSKSAKGVGVIYSSLTGFITLQPDYIGFGDSKSHYQPYLLKKSSANSVVDFTKAAIKFAKDNNIPMASDKGIYLTGYSQGGAVALAALDKFQQEGMQVNITTPMDGPYLLDSVAQGVLSLNETKAPSFMAAVAYSYTKTYNKNITEIIKEPYASKLPTLFDGTLTRVEIDKRLTNKVKGDGGLFTNDIVQNYQNSWLKSKLKQNSVVSFTPKNSVKMLHCLGDDIIPYAVAQGAKNIFDNMYNASSVDLISVETAITKNPNTKPRMGHADCALPAYKISSQLFLEARKQLLGY